MRNFAFLLLLLPTYIFGQDKSIRIRPTQSSIEIDGDISDAAWNNADIAKDFRQNFPNDSALSLSKTEVRVLFDKDFIYVAAKCYDELPGNFVVNSRKRDFSYPASDAFAIFIDPFSEGINGFSFAVNPYGAQREGTVIYGGNFGVTTHWDNKWYSAVKRQEGFWTVEMKIPFKSIRFPKNRTSWRVNFSRNDLKRNENSSWCHVPFGYNIASLNFCGEMIWEEQPDLTSRNIALIPYVSERLNQDFEKQSSDQQFLVGGDAKIAVTPALNLDLTINPEFSQVDVDEQFTNLSLFSIRFPERRQFFLENADLFANFGFSKIRPFLSRRIGLKSGQTIPIQYGAKLSGKISQKTRIGVLNMQTSADADREEPQKNFSVVALERTIFKRSNISGIFVNRQSFDTPSNPYSRIAGVDFNLLSADNKWRGKVFFHQSFEQNQPEYANANASYFLYSTKKWFIMWNHEYVGKNYMADVGFVPRQTHFNSIENTRINKTYWRWEPILRYNFYPKNSPIYQHQVSLYHSDYQDSEFKSWDRRSESYWKVIFKNSAEVQAGGVFQRTKLFYPRDVTFSGAENLGDGVYHYNFAYLNYQHNKRTPLTFNTGINAGQYFNGNRLQFNANINYRASFWGIFSLNGTWNQMQLPYLDDPVSLVLIGPKMEFSFSNNLFLTSFFQYNTQIDNLNTNIRLQWRYKPMSDLFVVYTDNYLATAENIFVRNRSFVIKLTYWLNV